MEKCTFCGEESASNIKFVDGYHVPENHTDCIKEIKEERE